MFASQSGKRAGVLGRRGIEQELLDLGRALERVGQPGPKAQLVSAFLYFWRKRSMRPAVSIIFCLPV